MIFISKDVTSLELRCTLCQEYFEGACFLEKVKTELYQIFFGARDLLLSDVPDLLKLLDNAIRNKGNIMRMRAHCFYAMGLVVKLGLAKKEMTPAMFLSYLDDAVQHRL